MQNRHQSSDAFKYAKSSCYFFKKCRKKCFLTKVQIFWEGHKLQKNFNLDLTLQNNVKSKRNTFLIFFGLLRISELSRKQHSLQARVRTLKVKHSYWKGVCCELTIKKIRCILKQWSKLYLTPWLHDFVSLKFH